MNVPAKASTTQAHQALLYERQFSPEFMPVRHKRIVRHDGYDLEVWLMPGSHALGFRAGNLRATELFTDYSKSLPSAGLLSAFLAAGEHEFEHTFAGGVTYMLSVQTEQLADNLYADVYREMLELAREDSPLVHEWSDEAGKCLSMVSVQRQLREIHAQAYHMLAASGTVIRTQSIFELGSEE